MIAHLRGTLISKSTDRAVVECSGVGYDVVISIPTFSGLPKPGGEVSLFVRVFAQVVHLTGATSHLHRALPVLRAHGVQFQRHTAAGLVHVPLGVGDITRLLARLFSLQIPIDTSAGREMLWSHAARLLPDRDAGVYNSALMDLGALVCTTRPKCEICPVKGSCSATEPTSLPRKSPRRRLELRTEHHSFSLRRRRVLLEQSQDRWKGMWMLPRLAEPPTATEALHLSQFPFTHHRITLAVYAHEPAPKRNQRQRWFPIDELASIPVPSPHRRALNRILALS